MIYNTVKVKLFVIRFLETFCMHYKIKNYN